jgi:hypothetical protein
LTPAYGPSCDLCSDPGVHYLLRCSKGHEWDEPQCPGEYTCPKCGETVSVTDDEDWLFLRNVVGVPEKELGKRPGPDAT